MALLEGKHVIAKDRADATPLSERMTRVTMQLAVMLGGFREAGGDPFNVTMRVKRDEDGNVVMELAGLEAQGRGFGRTT